MGRPIGATAQDLLKRVYVAADTWKAEVVRLYSAASQAIECVGAKSAQHTAVSENQETLTGALAEELFLQGMATFGVDHDGGARL